jgi:hypothetical protein
MITFGNVTFQSQNKLFAELGVTYGISTTTARNWFINKRLDEPELFDAHAVAMGKESHLSKYAHDGVQPDMIQLNLDFDIASNTSIEENRQKPVIVETLYPHRPVIVETLYPRHKIEVEILYPHKKEYMPTIAQAPVRVEILTPLTMAFIRPVNELTSRLIKYPVKIGDLYATDYKSLIQLIWRYLVQRHVQITQDEIAFAVNRLDVQDFMAQSFHLGLIHIYPKLLLDEILPAIEATCANKTFAYVDTKPSAIKPMVYRMTQFGHLLRNELGYWIPETIVTSTNNRRIGYVIDGKFIDQTILTQIAQADYHPDEFVTLEDLDETQTYDAVPYYTETLQLGTHYVLTK